MTQPMDLHAVVACRVVQMLVLAVDQISLGRRDHLDFMALGNEGTRQAADIRRIPAVAEGWIEGRDHAEAHQAVRRAWTSRRSSICAALLGQLNSAERGRHCALSRSRTAGQAETSAIVLPMSPESCGSKNIPAEPTTSATAPPRVAM